MDITPKELVEKIVRLLDAKKGSSIDVLHVGDMTVLTEYMIMCSGTSTTQVKALADEVEFKLKQEGILPLRTDGYDTASWIILDYGCVLVHIFEPQARDFYKLERLWAEGEKVDIDNWLIKGQE